MESWRFAAVYCFEWLPIEALPATEARDRKEIDLASIPLPIRRVPDIALAGRHMPFNCSLFLHRRIIYVQVNKFFAENPLSTAFYFHISPIPYNSQVPLKQSFCYMRCQFKMNLWHEPLRINEQYVCSSILRYDIYYTQV